MAPARRLLVVALSGRALAVAAWRAGFAPVVLDLFGDVDTRRVAAASALIPGDLAGGFDGGALLAAADRIAPPGSVGGVLYGSGLESAPELIAALAAGRTLYGNSAAAVRRIKDPRLFFPLLDRVGLPYPALSHEPPADPAHWLAKREGGAGGGHVVPADGARGAGVYYQRRASGRSFALLFAADGKRGRVLGFSSQWPHPAADQPFRFGGAVGPVSGPAAVNEALARALDPLVAETGLVGLNSLDMMCDDQGAFRVLEVNPRPGAALDVFDGPGPQSLAALHLAACAGALAHPWTPPPGVRAMAVVYADRPLAVPARLDWPHWLADRPASLALIAPGAPVCTVLAAAGDAPAARRLVAARASWVLAALAA